ncbi:MAG: hypothetical protein WD557_02400 [Dehalococcoidia bacterium]
MRAWAGAAIGVVVVAGAMAVGFAGARGGGDEDARHRGASPLSTSVPWTLTAAEGPPGTTQDSLVIRTVPQRDLVEGEPRALTTEECADALRRMEAQVTLREPKIAALTPAELPAWQAAVEESRAWFAAGCPLHDVLGYYPSTDGGGFPVIDY